MSPKISQLRINNIQPGFLQPRSREIGQFTEESLEELSRSIMTQGIIEPLIVRPLPPDDDQPDYELISGERRWRAARQAGIDQVPAIVRRLDDDEAAEIGLVENLQRDDLNPMEEARGLKNLRAVTDDTLTQQEIAERLGKTQGWVSVRLRLLELPENAQKALNRGDLTLEQARALFPYLERPAFVEAAVDVLTGEEHPGGVNVDAPPSDVLDQWARTTDWSRPLHPHVHPPFLKPLFDVDPDEWETIEHEKVVHHLKGGREEKTVYYTWEMERWNRLQREAILQAAREGEFEVQPWLMDSLQETFEVTGHGFNDEQLQEIMSTGSPEDEEEEPEDTEPPTREELKTQLQGTYEGRMLQNEAREPVLEDNMEQLSHDPSLWICLYAAIIPMNDEEREILADFLDWPLEDIPEYEYNALHNTDEGEKIIEALDEEGPRAGIFARERVFVYYANTDVLDMIEQYGPEDLAEEMKGAREEALEEAVDERLAELEEEDQNED